MRELQQIFMEMNAAINNFPFDYIELDWKFNDIKMSIQCILIKFDSFFLSTADFGFARFLNDGVMAATLCGSPMYMVSLLDIVSEAVRTVCYYCVMNLTYMQVVCKFSVNSVENISQSRNPA